MLLLSFFSGLFCKWSPKRRCRRGQKDLKGIKDPWYGEEQGEILKWIPVEHHGFVVCFLPAIDLNIVLPVG